MALTLDNCSTQYDDLMEKFEEYVRNGRLQDGLKHEIVKAA